MLAVRCRVLVSRRCFLRAVKFIFFFVRHGSLGNTIIWVNYTSSVVFCVSECVA
jgi:hypothetical protein